MVLQELCGELNIVPCWLLLTGVAWVFTMTLSGTIFYALFWSPTFSMWQSKTNPNYPTPQKVREEIIQMHKGLVLSSLPPALTVWLACRGIGRAYTGIPDSWVLEILAQLTYWFLLDFVEFLYHYASHKWLYLWRFHKFHHTFFNPSPFAVIADEAVGIFPYQLIRSSPMLFIPLLLPLNTDLLFIQMGLLNYAYGTYLHCGHEFSIPDAHQFLLNTSYHHGFHHTHSIIHKAYHCGFYLSLFGFSAQIFDRLFGSYYSGKCVCAKCCRKRGERSYDKWKEIKKPDYSALISYEFWKEGLKKEYRKTICGKDS